MTGGMWRSSMKSSGISIEWRSRVPKAGRVTTQEMEVMLLEGRQGGDLGDIPSFSDNAEDKQSQRDKKTTRNWPQPGTVKERPLTVEGC